MERNEGGVVRRRIENPHSSPSSSSLPISLLPQSSSLPLSLLPLFYLSPSLLSSSYYLSPFFLVVRRTITLINFPRKCLQWFLKIDQSECSKSPIDLDNGFNADRKFKMVDSEGQNCFENL
jgi:hypothetical protein